MSEALLAPEIMSLEQIDNIGDYLATFGGDLIKRLNEEYTPVHHPGNDLPLTVLEELKRPLFSAQAHVTTALIKMFEKSNRAFLIGEMGTGKSSMSVATFFAYLKLKRNGKGRVIYMVPNHLIKKTEREIGILLDKSIYEVHHLRSFKDVIQLKESGKMNRRPQKMEIYIIARDTCKLGYIYEPSPKWRERVYTKNSTNDATETKRITAFSGWICPDCGGQLMKVEEDSSIPMEYEDFFNKHGKPTRRKNNLACSNLVRLYKTADPEQDEYKTCGARLWSSKNRDKSSFSGLMRRPTGPASRKTSPADLFKRYFKNKFDFAIGDECHECATR